MDSIGAVIFDLSIGIICLSLLRRIYRYATTGLVFQEKSMTLRHLEPTLTYLKEVLTSLKENQRTPNNASFFSQSATIKKQTYLEHQADKMKRVDTQELKQKPSK